MLLADCPKSVASCGLFIGSVRKMTLWQASICLLQDSYLILDTLPAEYDSRVKAMEVDEKPTEDYSDIGGLDKQIQELVEAIVLPVTHKVSDLSCMQVQIPLSPLFQQAADQSCQG
jgi:ATP-dependent 26S proteasome regulatory subunit